MSASTLIDAETAAGLLGVKTTWVMDAARRGQLPHVKVGRYTRFFEDELLEWARARQRGPVVGSRA